MNKPCRMALHRHLLLDKGTMYVGLMADQQRFLGEHVLRVRWLTTERMWQVCYRRAIG